MASFARSVLPALLALPVLVPFGAIHAAPEFRGEAAVAAAGTGADRIEELEQRLTSAVGRERLEILAELVHASRRSAVPDAARHGEEARQLLEEMPDARLEVRLLGDLAFCASRDGDMDEALVLGARARDLAVAHGDREGEALADYVIGVAHWYRSEHDAALGASERARKIQVELGDDGGLATTLTLIGAVHRSRSDYHESLDAHIQSLEVSEAAGDVAGIARSRNNIALVYWKLDQHAKARDYLERAVPAYRELGNEDGLSTALSNLGLILIEMGEPENSLPVLIEAMELKERLGRVRGKDKILGNLAFAYDSIGDTERALELYERTLEMREDLEDHWGRARSLACIARIHVNQGRYEEAALRYEQASLAAEAAGAREEQASIQRGLAETYEALGRFEESLAALRLHQEILRELDGAETARRIAELEAEVRLEAEKRSRESELGRQRQSQILLAGSTVVLLILAAGFFALSRARKRSLVATRRSHEDLKELTNRLQESEERYSSVFNDAVVPKLLLDLEDGRVLDANGPAGRFCGREHHELVGMEVASLEPAWLARTLADLPVEEARRVEEWMDPAGGPRQTEIWSAPLNLAGRPCVVVTLGDVTRQRRDEEERIRSDKLESLGLLAGGIAHDFNNALTAVLGHVSLARLRGRSSEVDRSLARAESGIEHATHLTAQLLAFAKGGEPQRRLAEVRALLTDTVQFSLSGSNVRVTFELAEDLWDADLDTGQFKQAISNLVINAVQAMPAGGQLLVRAQNVRSHQALSALAGPGSYVRIDVEDEGRGIPAELQHKILDPYFTTKEGGSGLGLATAFAVASRHGGWLDFRSVEGQGTSFSLYFPAAPGRRAQPDAEPRGVFVGRGRILVMDDDPAVQRVFADLLPQCGYEFEIVENGRDAIDTWMRARGEGRPFDAVIMDLTIPGGMGGRQAMEELRRRDPAAVGFVVSGYANDAVMSKHREAGFAGALGKPFDITALGRLLAEGLGQREDPSSPRRASNRNVPPRTSTGPR